ncbi:2,5-dihydroxypyridine 5,6-dioxygenase [bacterium HR37]|nr:2,5-dihydroxypyridine 5,6-dioxygenase [bacterium HR37]
MKGSLYDAAMIALRDCMAVKSGEKVLIITDEPLRKIGYVLWECAKELGTEAMLLEIIPRDSHGQEPPQPVGELMRLVDVILIPTSKSLSHTESRRKASSCGVRIATLPGITEDTMIRTLNADYHKIAQRSRKVASILKSGSRVRITTERGTDISLVIEGREGYADTGLNHNPGDFSNLPAGEGYIAPLEGKSEGKVVIDGSMAGIGKLEEEVIEITVKNGFAVEIKGGEAADKLLSLMKPFGRLAFNVAELGIGTNDKAIVTGNVLEDEKAMGTIHIAFGDNKSMGGTVRVASHLDGVVMNPTVYVDDVLLLDNGRLLVS